MTDGRARLLPSLDKIPGVLVGGRNMYYNYVAYGDWAKGSVQTDLNQYGGLVDHAF
jgi:hypothetical protein